MCITVSSFWIFYLWGEGRGWGQRRGSRKERVSHYLISSGIKWEEMIGTEV